MPGRLQIIGRIKPAAPGARVDVHSAYDNHLITTGTAGRRSNFVVELHIGDLRRVFGGRQPQVHLKAYAGAELIASTEEPLIIERDDTVIEVTLMQDMPVGPPIEPPPPPADEQIVLPLLEGQLLNGTNNQGLVGVDIRALWYHPDLDVDDDTVVIADIATSSSGRFGIVPPTIESIPDEVRAALEADEPAVTLQIRLNADETHTHLEPFAISDFPVTIPVPIDDVELEDGIWREVGSMLIEGRVARLMDISKQLIRLPSTQSIFGNLDIATRHTLFNELEAAFLDPDGVLAANNIPVHFHQLQIPDVLAEIYEKIEAGDFADEVAHAFDKMEAKVEAFASLTVVDWLIDPNQLDDENVGGAVAYFEQLYSSGNISETELDAALLKFEQTQLGTYRDYLRTIYTGLPNAEYQIGYWESPTNYYPELLGNLQRRFHQDFESYNDIPLPANAIVKTILLNILTSPTGDTYGFGLPAPSINPQGARTDREYLDYLIGLTNLSADELGRRYRIDFQRPDSAMSSVVQEHVATLQGFYRDGFQSQPDPYPLYSDKLDRHAPFFLYFDEWLEQSAPFYAENYIPIRDVYTLSLKNKQSYVGTPTGDMPFKLADWFANIDSKIQLANKRFQLQQYEQAQAYYVEALVLCDNALEDLIDYLKTPLTTVLSRADVSDRFFHKITTEVVHPKDLELFISTYFNVGIQKPTNEAQYTNNMTQYICELLQVMAYVLPTCLGDVALARGDYVTAVGYYELNTRYLVARTKPEVIHGYPRPYGTNIIPDIEKGGGYPRYFTDGFLPYTGRYKSDAIPTGLDWSMRITKNLLTVTKNLALNRQHIIERKFFHLRHGNALLAWADALYQTDIPANIARARELYKAVLFLHQEHPPISPQWSSNWNFGNSKENPAIASQKARARQRFAQIEAGLNYYGYSDALIPILRYNTLKEAADRFAAAAKSSQQDFLRYMEQLETAIKDSLTHNNMLKKAQFQAEIASEQSVLAAANVADAEKQVQKVKAAIQKISDELNSKDDFFNQFTDFVGGMVEAYKDVKDFTGSPKEIGAGMLAGSGASVMTGYGLFVYGGYTSLSGMAAAANSLRGQRETLRNTVLPAAVEQVKLRQREANIVDLQRQIAEADAQLASELIFFQTTRFLSITLWNELATVMKRIMQCYLELGARFAWFAERALAYEQNRAINLIRFNYYPAKSQGLGGADLLQLDLAELEASRLGAIKQAIPVKQTVSLAFDYPLQFAQLRRTGVCRIRTEELPLRLRYPGLYAYRIASVDVDIEYSRVGQPVKGLLINEGYSLISDATGKANVSLRNQDHYPISEFRIPDDMPLYPQAEEALLVFEGSGIDSFWRIELPHAGNPTGRDHVSDVRLTFNLRAQQSRDLYALHRQQIPTKTRRFVFVAASASDPNAITALQTQPGNVSITFDLAKAQLAANGSNRKVKNAVVLLVNDEPVTVDATLNVGTSALFKITDSMAISNGAPLEGSAGTAPSPLNALANHPMPDIISLAINKSSAPAANYAGISDVIIGIEYEADITA